MRKEHEMIHLLEMNDEISIRLDSYLFDANPTKEEMIILTKFVTYVVKQNLEAIDEPRKCGSYREISNYE